MKLKNPPTEKLTTSIEENPIIPSTQNLTITKSKKPLNKKVTGGLMFLGVLGMGYSTKTIFFRKRNVWNGRKIIFNL